MAPMSGQSDDDFATAAVNVDLDGSRSDQLDSSGADALDRLAEAALSSQEEQMEQTAALVDEDGPTGWSGPKENVMRELTRARACLEVGDYEGGRRLLAELATSHDQEVAQIAQELLQALSLH